MGSVKLHVEVTAEDIANGKRETACYCPIALALKRLGVKDPDVFGEREECVSVPCDDDEEPWDHYQLPDEAIDFVVKFDLGAEVAPFAFDLEVHESAVRS